MWTVINAPEHGWGSARTIGGFVLGAALLVVLAVTERRHPHPLLRPALLRSRQRIAGLVAMACVYGGMLATFFLTVQLLSHQFDYSPIRSGVAFLPVPLGVFTMSRLAPRLVARIGPAPLIAAGTASVFVAMGLLLGVDASTGYVAGVFPSLLLMGWAWAQASCRSRSLPSTASSRSTPALPPVCCRPCSNSVEPSGSRWSPPSSPDAARTVSTLRFGRVRRGDGARRSRLRQRLHPAAGAANVRRDLDVAALSSWGAFASDSDANSPQDGTG